MSTIYTGKASNVSTNLSATVSGATNVSPIVVTTVANHLFATGDSISISGVLGNTAANGVWTITVLSSTTFSLTGSTGNGAYTSGGTAVDQSLTPQFTIPSDGDARNAASVNVALQALADRTQFLNSLLIQPTRKQLMLPQMQTASDFSFNNTFCAWVQQNTAGIALWPIGNLPSSGSLLRIRIGVSGKANSGAGFVALPVLPVLNIYYTDSSGIVQAPAPSNVADPSTTVAQFNAFHTHTISLTTPLSVSSFKELFLRLDGASGANFVANNYGVLFIEADFG